MKKTVISLLALLLTAQIWAVDLQYYASLEGKSGDELRQAITAIVYQHHTTDPGYSWAFDNIDVVNGVVLDMYSTCDWTPVTDQCGQVGVICHCYNREHTVPQNVFNEKLPQKSDRHHLFLTDGKVNGLRSNYPFGEASENTISGTNSDHALGKLGPATEGYTGTVYEPDDMYKGDIARAILYMVVRYATQNECRKYNGTSNSYHVATWTNNLMFNGNYSVNYGLSDAAVTFFLRWHRADKVSTKEIARNTGVENLQGNRNPFVDFPFLVEYLWGSKKGVVFHLADAIPSFDPAFIPGESDGAAESPTALEDVPVSHAAQIVIENGQLLIVREGAVYSVTGARIR